MPYLDMIHAMPYLGTNHAMPYHGMNHAHVLPMYELATPAWFVPK
jgi:hypothetical protein